MASKIFDWLLKGLVGMIVICFFGVTVFLTYKGALDWGAIFAGFVPDFSQWTSPTGKVAEILQNMPSEAQQYWEGRVVSQQRTRMIGAAATAVGINMTFLMPYSMLHRGWDRPFRGLARFDLMTGMAIPYILVTSCVVIASAYAFNGKADQKFLSTDPAVFQTSPTFGGGADILLPRAAPEIKEKKFKNAAKKMKPAQKEAVIAKMAKLPEGEKLIASSMVQRNAAALSQTLAPLIGEKFANFVFGLGVFGMGFSTIIILMLINGFVFCEALGKPDSTGAYVAGCLVAGVVGMMWPFVWDGDSKIWLAILASSFGMMLLPIAYVTFFMMMNSHSLLGKEKPTSLSMVVWNILMLVSVVGAIAAAAVAIYDKATDKSDPTKEMASWAVIGMVVVYLLLVGVGFFLTPRKTEKSTN